MALPAKLKKHRLLKIAFREIFAAGYMVVFLIAMLWNAFHCFLTGHTQPGLISLVLFVALLWLWIPPLVACVLRFHFWRHLHDRQYGRIDVAYWRAANVLKKLGRPLYLEMITSDLALMRLAQGYYDSAVTLYQEAFRGAHLMQPKQRDRNRYEQRLAMYKGNLATALIRNNKPIEAELLLEESLEKFTGQKSEPFADVFRGCAHNALGSIRLDLGELDSAEEQLNCARKIWEGLGAKRPVPKMLLDSYMTVSWLLLASLYLKRNDLSNAQLFCDKAVSLLRENDIGLPSLQLKHINHVADGYLSKGLYKEAEDLLEISYQFASELPYHPDSQRTLANFENLLRLTDRQSEIADMRSFLKSVDLDKAPNAESPT